MLADFRMAVMGRKVQAFSGPKRLFDPFGKELVININFYWIAATGLMVFDSFNIACIALTIR